MHLTDLPFYIFVTMHSTYYSQEVFWCDISDTALLPKIEHIVRYQKHNIFWIVFNLT